MYTSPLKIGVTSDCVTAETELKLTLDGISSCTYLNKFLVYRQLQIEGTGCHYGLAPKYETALSSNGMLQCHYRFTCINPCKVIFLGIEFVHYYGFSDAKLCEVDVLML